MMALKLNCRKWFRSSEKGPAEEKKIVTPSNQTFLPITVNSIPAMWSLKIKNEGLSWRRPKEGGGGVGCWVEI